MNTASSIKEQRLYMLVDDKVADSHVRATNSENNKKKKL
jgi:hypothetical protein